MEQNQNNQQKRNWFWAALAGFGAVIAAIIRIILNRQQPTPEESAQQRREDLAAAQTQHAQRSEEIRNMTDEEVVQTGTTQRQRDDIGDIVAEQTRETMDGLDRFRNTGESNEA